MSPPLLFVLVCVAAVCIRLARAQFSNITCTPEHAWMSNSRGQNPCLIAAYLSVPCIGGTAAVDEPLDPGQFYDGPLFGPDQCSCNTVMYSIVEACQLCQFDTGGGPEVWSAWSRECNATQIGLGLYPMAIQPGTAVPAWAYLDVVKADRFNETAALLVAAANVPESTAVSSASSTSTTTTITFSTASATSQSTTSTTSSQQTAMGLGAAVGSGSNHSDSKGPLVGGIVGGVLGLLLIGALVFYILLRHRRLAGAAHAQPDSGSGGHAAVSAEGTLSRSGTPGPYGHPATLKERMMSPTESMVYDPDDPRTFPPQMGVAPMGGSVDGHMRETTVTSGYASSLGYRPTAVGSIYRGAPEVSP